MCVIALKKRVIIEKYMLHMCRTCLRFVTFLSFLQYHSDPVIVDCTSMSSELTGRANSWFCNVLMEFFLVWCDGKLQNSSWMDLVVRFLFSKLRTTFELLSQRGREVLQDLRGQKIGTCTSTTGPTLPADEEHVTWQKAPEPDLKVWAVYLFEQILVFPEEQIRRKFARDKWWILQKAITLNLSNPA